MKMMLRRGLLTSLQELLTQANEFCTVAMLFISLSVNVFLYFLNRPVFLQTVHRTMDVVQKQGNPKLIGRFSENKEGI